VSALTAWVGARVDGRGSPRVLALLRIGVALQLWSRFGVTFALHRVESVAWAVLAVTFWVGSTLLLVGWRASLGAVLSGVAVAGAYGWLAHAHHLEALASHHVQALLIALICLAPADLDASLSPRWLAGRAEGTSWLAPQHLVALLVSVMYAGGAFEKSNLGFLSGERLEQVYRYTVFGSDPFGPWLGWLCLLLAVVTVLVEWGLVVLPWWPRARLPALAVGAVFHGAVYHQLPVVTFTTTMLVLYLAFLDPDRVAVEMDCTDGEPAARRGALGRVLVVALVWAQFAGPLRLPHHLDMPWVMALSLVVYVGSAAWLLGWRTRWAGGLTWLALGAVWWGVEAGGASLVRPEPLWFAGGVVWWVAGVALLTGGGAAWSLDRKAGRSDPSWSGAAPLATATAVGVGLLVAGWLSSSASGLALAAAVGPLVVTRGGKGAVPALVVTGLLWGTLYQLAPLGCVPAAAVLCCGWAMPLRAQPMPQSTASIQNDSSMVSRTDGGAGGSGSAGSVASGLS